MAILGGAFEGWHVAGFDIEHGYVLSLILIDHRASDSPRSDGRKAKCIFSRPSKARFSNFKSGSPIVRTIVEEVADNSQLCRFMFEGGSYIEIIGQKVTTVQW